MYSEDRLKSLSWIEVIIDRAIYVLNFFDFDTIHLSSTGETVNLTFEIFLNALSSCRLGLDNLYLTYCDDPAVQGRIREMQKKIEKRVHSKGDSDLLYRNVWRFSSNDLHRLEYKHSLPLNIINYNKNNLANKYKKEDNDETFISQSYPNTDLKRSIKHLD